MRNLFFFFLVISLFFTNLTPVFSGGSEGGELYAEGGFNFSEGYRYRLSYNSNLFSCSASIKGEWDQIEGNNLTFNAGPLYLGSILPLGLVKEILIPSITRKNIEINSGSIRSDRAYTGSSRRGAGLTFCGGKMGLFLLRLKDRWEGGFWGTQEWGAFSPGLAVVLSNPGRDNDTDSWIYDAPPFLSDHTASVLFSLSYFTPLYSIFFLSGGSFSNLDSSGWWCRGGSRIKTTIIDLSFQAGGASSAFRTPAGGRMDECFDWKGEIVGFPESLFSFCLECGESQEHEQLVPESFLPFSSFIGGSFLVKPKYWELVFKGEFSHEGAGSGTISRESTFLGKIDYERRGVHLQSDFNFCRREASEENIDEFSWYSRGRFQHGRVIFSLFCDLKGRGQIIDFSTGGRVEVHEGSSLVYLQIKPSWCSPLDLESDMAGCIIENWISREFLNIFKENCGFEIEFGFKMMKEENTDL
ncbi:MAG: hypothetical protein JEY99_16645 [Spirochaetales bacterium]|nr:hypothetical protein [Spirochaetales bacterium]